MDDSEARPALANRVRRKPRGHQTPGVQMRDATPTRPQKTDCCTAREANSGQTNKPSDDEYHLSPLHPAFDEGIDLCRRERGGHDVQASTLKTAELLTIVVSCVLSGSSKSWRSMAMRDLLHRSGISFVILKPECYFRIQHFPACRRHGRSFHMFIYVCWIAGC